MNLATISFIITLIVAAGAIATVVGGSFRTGRISRYREEAELWEQRARRFEGDAEALKSATSTQAEKIATLEGQVAMLKDMVSSKAAIESLTTDFASWISQVNTRVDNVLDQMSAMRIMIREMQEAVSRKTPDVGGASGKHTS